MNTVLENSIKNALSYEQYRELIKNLLSKGLTTGDDTSEPMVEYTRLNDKRMQRLDKTTSLTNETLEQLSEIHDPIHWIVITEGWCGDASQIVPIINKMAIANPMIKLHLVLRDENKELMDFFLTNGGRAIPKLIMFDPSSKEVLGHWGPRPNGAQKTVETLKEQFGGVTQEVKEGLQKWYNSDKGVEVQQEILHLLTKSVL